MKESIRLNQRLIVVLIIVVALLYSLAGGSDHMDTSITQKQRQAVVASWGQP